MVFSIFIESTTPSRTSRGFGRAVASVVVSAITALQCLVSGDLALAKDRVQSCDLALHLAETSGVLLLPRRELEAKVEQRLLRLLDAVDELGVAEIAQRCALPRHDQTSASTPERVTNLALIGSFWMARSMAPRASSS